MTLVSVEIPMEDVHEQSLDFLSTFEDQGTPINVAVPALIMTLGRVMSPKVMDEEEEVAFIQAAIEFAGTYFADGSVN